MASRAGLPHTRVYVPCAMHALARSCGAAAAAGARSAALRGGLTAGRTAGAALAAASSATPRAPAVGARGYHQNVIDHYENPRNVGALLRGRPSRLGERSPGSSAVGAGGSRSDATAARACRTWACRSGLQPQGMAAAAAGRCFAVRGEGAAAWLPGS